MELNTWLKARLFSINQRGKQHVITKPQWQNQPGTIMNLPNTSCARALHIPPVVRGLGAYANQQLENFRIDALSKMQGALPEPALV